MYTILWYNMKDIQGKFAVKTMNDRLMSTSRLLTISFGRYELLLYSFKQLIVFFYFLHYAQRIPTTCHLHVKVTNVECIVQDATDLESIMKCVEKWLDQSYQEKDRQMEYFIKHQQFDDKWTKHKVGKKRIIR